MHVNVDQVNYAAAKAGILGMMHTVSSKMHRHGVRMNALVPTPTRG